jgi:hypothetical protein
MFKNNSEKCGRKQKLKALSQKKNLFIEHVLKCETKPKFSNDLEGFRARHIYNLETWIKNSKNKKDIKFLKSLLKQAKLELKKEEIKQPVISEQVKKVVKKIDIQKIEKSPFTLTAPKENYSRLVHWVDAFKPVNVGKLGSSQAWRIEKPAPEYY